jgi:hypothetical protein
MANVRRHALLLLIVVHQLQNCPAASLKQPATLAQHIEALKQSVAAAVKAEDFDRVTKIGKRLALLKQQQENVLQESNKVKALERAVANALKQDDFVKVTRIGDELTLLKQQLEAHEAALRGGKAAQGGMQPLVSTAHHLAAKRKSLPKRSLHKPPSWAPGRFKTSKQYLNGSPAPDSTRPTPIPPTASPTPLPAQPPPTPSPTSPPTAAPTTAATLSRAAVIPLTPWPREWHYMQLLWAKNTELQYTTAPTRTNFRCGS